MEGRIAAAAAGDSVRPAAQLAAAAAPALLLPSPSIRLTAAPGAYQAATSRRSQYKDAFVRLYRQSCCAACVAILPYGQSGSASQVGRRGSVPVDFRAAGQ